MVAVDALAIGIGAILGTRLPERAIRLSAATAFVVFGTLLVAQGLALIQRLAPRAPRGRPGDQPLGSTTIVTSGVIPERTLIATLYVPSDLSGSSRSILWRSTTMPRRPSASAMSLAVIDP